MKINLVTETEQQRWALRPRAEALARYLPGAVVTCKADPDADVNIFINYALFTPVDTITIGWFTHRESGERGERFDQVARDSDWCLVHSRNTAKLLPSEKTAIIAPGPANAHYYGRPLVLGISGRNYSSGRKRSEWIPSLEAIPGVVVRQTRGKLKSASMPAWYDSIDYLVVLSSNEGGPNSVVEAIARGVPVIAPDVGYCWEYPVLRFTTQKELLDLVRKLVIPGDTWARAAEVVMEIINRWQ